MGTFKKTAAVICSAATLAFAGLSATVFAYDTVKLEDRASELSSGNMMFIADEVYAQAGETVEYSVYVQNNTGYVAGGIALNYDPALEVVMANSIKAYCVKGPGAEGLTSDHSLNKEASIFGFSVMGNENCTNDGKVYTIKFVVPDGAQPGSTYPVKLDIVELLNRKNEQVDYTTVAGWIKVPYVTATTTTTTTKISTTSKTVTSTTTSTTAVVTSTSTVAPVTSTSTMITTTSSVAPPTPGTSTTTKAVPDQGDGTTTTSAPIPEGGTTTSTDVTRHTDRVTDDTQHNPGDEEQTTANRNGGNGNNGNGNNGTPSPGKKTDATKTGDAGVAVAIAALLIASSSVVMFRRKK